MKLYYLVLILILVSLAEAQPLGFNAANDTVISNSSSIVSTQLQKPDETRTPVQYSDIFDLDFAVLELDENTRARFGVGKMEAAKHEMYKISIMNKGDIRITDVIASAKMDKGMKFESTRYYEENRGRLDVVLDPPNFKNETKTNLKWDIGTLEPEEIKTILLEAYIKPGVNNKNITVDVTGEVGAEFPVSASKDRAEVTECLYLDKNTGKRCDTLSETCLVDSCPDWSIPQ